MTDEELTVCRQAPPLYVDGKPTPQPFNSYKMKCNVQPLTGLDLMRVPEFDRHRERFVVFSSELDRPAQLNDRIVRAGINYQVETLETWGDARYGYQRLIISRIDAGPNKTP